MTMSVNLHTKKAEKFEVEAYITNSQYSKDYAVFKIAARDEGGYKEVTIFPEYEQVKEIHKQLSKLMKEIKKLEKKVPPSEEEVLSWLK